MSLMAWVRHHLSNIGYVILAVSMIFAVARLEANDNHIQDLRRQRIEDVAHTDNQICEEMNSLKRGVQDALRLVATVRQREGTLTGERIATYRHILQRFQPIDCNKLPSQRPFEE